jgi:hypothetical protein
MEAYEFVKMETINLCRCVKYRIMTYKVDLSHDIQGRCVKYRIMTYALVRVYVCENMIYEHLENHGLKSIVVPINLIISLFSSIYGLILVMWITLIIFIFM